MKTWKIPAWGIYSACLLLPPASLCFPRKEGLVWFGFEGYSCPSCPLTVWVILVSSRRTSAPEAFLGFYWPGELICRVAAAAGWALRAPRCCGCGTEVRTLGVSS